MSKRITKTMAEEASDRMKRKAYSKKIENAKTKINKVVEELAKKYIPAPVLACVDEYKDYFNKTNVVGITTMYETKYGLRRENSIHGNISFYVPTLCGIIKVERKEYDALLKLSEKKKQLEKQRDEFGKQVYEALVALRTDKAVEKELPEAMKYLTFPEAKAVPMPVFTGLRDIIGQINDDD